MLNKTGYFFTNSLMSPTQKTTKNDRQGIKGTQTAQSMEMKTNEAFQFRSNQIQQSIRESHERQQLLSKYSSKGVHSSQSKFQQPLGQDQEKSKSHLKERRQPEISTSIAEGQALQQSQTDQSTLNNTFVNNFTFTFKINDTFGNKNTQQPSQQVQESPRKQKKTPEPSLLVQQQSSRHKQSEPYYQVTQSQQHSRKHYSSAQKAKAEGDPKDYLYQQNCFMQEQQFYKQSQQEDQKYCKVQENVYRQELSSTIKNPADLLSLSRHVESGAKNKKGDVLHETSEVIIKNSKRSQHTTNPELQAYQQRLKEKEQVIQQLQNYYSKLSDNYEQSKKNMQTKITELQEQIKIKDTQLTSLQGSNKKLQAQIESKAHSKNKTIQNMNNSFKSGDSSEIELSEKYTNYNTQFRSSQNEETMNPMQSQRAIINLKHQSKVSEINLTNNKQNAYMKRNQSASQMINLDQPHLQSQPSTASPLEKQPSSTKYMRSFQKFYESLIKMIKDCNPNKYVDNIIATGDQKKGLKFIWKWIKTLMDDYMKMKTKIKIQQAKELNYNTELHELFSLLSAHGADAFMAGQKDNSKLRAISELYQKQNIKHN